MLQVFSAPNHSHIKAVLQSCAALNEIIEYKHMKKPQSCDWGFKFGAGTKSRTRDLLITSQLLYQLSYTGWVLLCYCFLYPLRSGGFLLVPAPRVELGTF